MAGTDSFQWIICQRQIPTLRKRKKAVAAEPPSERVRQLGSKKFYFCRRQNGAARRRRNPPPGGHRGKVKLGGKKTWKRGRGERERGAVRPTHSENASQTDTESEATDSSPSPFRSRVRRLAISQRRRFSHSEGDGFRRYLRLDDDHSFLDIVLMGKNKILYEKVKFFEIYPLVTSLLNICNIY